MAVYWFRLFAFACIASSGEGRVLLGQKATRDLSVEASGTWAAYEQAESEDRSFLLSQLDDTESELMRLQQFVKNVQVAGKNAAVLAGLQIAAKPTKKNGIAAPPANATRSEVNGTSMAKKQLMATAPMDPAKLVASLGIHLPNSNLKGAMALAPMLAMLKGLYADSKDRISTQNTREEKSKKWFASKSAEHTNKLAEIEGKFKNHTLSEEFRTNETRDETRYFGYWSRVRERQHRQFHTNLKIQHAMMTKVKKMIDMYEKTLSGKAGDQEQAKKQLGQVAGGMPEIVFLQGIQHSVVTFCRESLAEVRKEQAELKQYEHEAVA
jgi:glutaredoxin 2